MKLATRLNSYLGEGLSLDQTFTQLAEQGLTHVDLNYPEHAELAGQDEMAELLAAHNLKLNGVAMRYRDKKFLNGEFSNPDANVWQTSLQMAEDACDYCRALGGHVLTVWLAYDGFDYSFQMAYAQAWDQLISMFQKICDYAPDLQISIEYKPYEERSYALVDSFGCVLALIDEINRDNIGATLDFCHMLMKHDNPALAADILGKKSKLFGIHLNDGYGRKDDGLMIATSNLLKTVEFLYYVKKHDYPNAIFFDTFPIREDAEQETAQNVAVITKLDRVIDELGIEWFDQQVSKRSGLSASTVLLKVLGE